MTDETEGMTPEEAKAAAAAAAKDYRNYPRSPEPGKGPVPYAPEGPLPTVEGEPAAPVFPIGSEPEVLADTNTDGGETDQERMENKAPALETPAHCPMCRGRGFIGGAVCPDCGGSGVAPGGAEPPDTNVPEDTEPNL